ncbi:Tat pathway signal sequence domain protein [Sphingobacterium sp. DN00404]|uniref:Tat pathway signal sequence domain protein n=1 Tax=Sphingobacterium micropteri TaxID=2763501 RepID=A0ABR7YTR3_9SPHI|nr:Tat pathway signal sequence domain protein [Sphingobacterium micropteri]MBD1434670.1 Tat pathway signal sequence domain protein [Sphingobacterium micropteri]
MRRQEKKPSQQSRRQFLKQSSVLLSSLPFYGKVPFAMPFPIPKHQHGTNLHWLGNHAPDTKRGVTWGVPWSKGALKDAEALVLAAAGEANLCAQHWVTARWPDGSVKWSAHAAVLGREDSGADLVLHKEGARLVRVDKSIVVAEDDDAIRVNTGSIQCVFPKKGGNLIKSIQLGTRMTATDGQLVLYWQNLPEQVAGEPLLSEVLTSEIRDAVVEHAGPIRVVIKTTGIHRSDTGRELLPFTVRCYCYLDTSSIRMVHTLVYDADEYTDFIRGLGVRFTVPMTDPLYDRHIRFCGDNGGVFGEAVKGLTGLRRDPGKEIRDAQIAGNATPPISTFNPSVAKGLPYIPSFGDYSLTQLTPDGFEIRKRTTAGHGWLSSAHGSRAAGAGYIGGASGGLVFGIRNFWQSYPAQIDIRHAHTDAAGLTLWLWAPHAPAMDLRFYHDGMGQDTYEEQLAGLDITYEDYEPEFGTPYGVARTSELEILAVDRTPTHAELANRVKDMQHPPLLVCNPTYYEKSGVFGGAFTAGPPKSVAEKAIEEQLAFYIDYYKKQIEQHRWYGFWNYGDVMHNYDHDRHVWRYDVGGYAWDNSELSTDLWLWYYFLRSGRHDVFRMAEAMTRHTGEVDVHHIGRFAPLGSRHNVMHWGCSAKQLRISTVMNRRFLYYLTADERIGDLMREQIEAVHALQRIVPGRKVGQIAAKGEDKVSMSFGTDWGALASAWFTEWERTGDEEIKQRLLNSMESIGNQPQGFLTSSANMDVHSGTFERVGNSNIHVSHLSAAFGLPEICAELIGSLHVPVFTKAWLQYCEAYNADPAWQKRYLGQTFSKPNLGQGHSRLTAYAGWFLKDLTLKERAWKEFYAGASGMKLGIPSTIRLAPPEVLSERDEAPLSTNAVAQWGLAAMQCLAFAGDPMEKGA